MIQLTGRSGSCTWGRLTAAQRRKMGKAVRDFKGAADQGHSYVQSNLGFVCEKGQCRSQNCKKAAVWYRRAAYQGYSNAQFTPGNTCYKGQRVYQSYEAAMWFQKAADQGDVRTQCNLGVVYF